MKKINIILISTAVFLQCFISQKAGAALGDTIILPEKSKITVEFLSSSAKYNNLFGLSSPKKINLGYGKIAQPGQKYDLGEFEKGKELVFFIKYAGKTWYSGPASRNSDKIAHAIVTLLEQGKWKVAFEDQKNGGDKDYDDIILSVASSPVETPPQDANLIQNASLETGSAAPEKWQKNSWGQNNAVLTYPASGKTGRGALIAITSYTDGDAKWYFNPIAVDAGKEYIFSDYYISTAQTNITAQYALADGSLKYVYLGSAPAAGGWQQFSTIFTVPDNAVSITVFHALTSAGTLSVDDFLLKKSDFVYLPFNQGMLSFNFDDGWFSAYQNGLPILNKYGIKSTYYIISEALGEKEVGYMGKEQLLDLQKQGNEIGAHSKSHASLISLTQQQMKNEIQGCKSDLEAMGFSNITSFAYPFGDWNETVKNIVKQSGYLGARTAIVADSGFNSKNSDKFVLKTMPVLSNTPVADIKKWIDKAYAEKTWLVLLFHKVDSSGEEYSTTPQHLQEIADYANQKKIKTITVGEGLKLMQ